jgi:hypothetical protein
VFLRLAISDEQSMALKAVDKYGVNFSKNDISYQFSQTSVIWKGSAAVISPSSMALSIAQWQWIFVFLASFSGNIEMTAFVVDNAMF